MQYQLYATCPDELKELLADEIKALGGTDVRTDFRVVYFSATQEVAYKAHLHLRMASRIRLILKDIPAHSPTIIFDKARKIRFDELFPSEIPVSINITTSGDGGKIENHLIGSKIREAINDSFFYHKKSVPNQNAHNAPISIYGFYHNKRLMLSIDTTFESLHKRNYRLEGHPAPLKETLAAALLAACEFNGTQNFYDPMCGSGTIAIEAAQIACHRAPQMYRAKGGFGFEYLNDFDKALWEKVRNEARQSEQKPKTKLFASDIDKDFVEMTRKAAIKAGIPENGFQTQVKDFFKTEKPAESGILIANIPYGVRLDQQEISVDYMRSIGDHLKNNFKGWRCGILAPVSSPFKEIGLKPQKRISFLNGKVPVKFLIFDIY